MTQSFADPGTPQGGGGGTTRTATVELNANVSGYTNQVGQAAQQTGLLSKGVDELSGKMAGLNKWAGKKLFHFAAADFSVLTAATADAATFEKQLSTLAATAAITGTSMQGIKGGIESAFVKFPVARGAVIDLVEAITNLGVTSATSIGSLSRTFIKLGAATGEPMTQLATGLIQLSRLMGSTDAGQIGNYANSLLTVSKNAGVSASGVLQFAQSIAPIARQAGIGEAAVLGISTAFSKAGADGFVATNAFNSIMSDISSSIATGSPELSKYANLIGATSSQLSKMDKSDAIVKIFNAIGKQGPQAVAILNNLGLTGQRSQAAIAAITQSGDLQKNISEALGSQGDQGNLTKGSDAAFNNLADSMVNVRNQFTQFGTEIGTTFLAPMTLAANLASKVGHHLNALVAPFAPIVATTAAIAGGAAGVGSMALSAAGVIGTYALMKNVKGSRAVAAFRAGTTIGGPREDLSKGAPLDRYTSGQMGRVESTGMVLGSGLRNLAGKAGITPAGMTSPWRDPQVLRNALVAGPLGAATGLSRMNEQFLRGNTGPTVGSLPLMQRLNMFGESLRGKTMVESAAMMAKPLAGQLGSTAQATAGVGVGLAGRVLRAGWQFAGPTVVGALVGGATGIPGGGRLANAAMGSAPSGSIRAESAAGAQAAAMLRMRVRMLGDGLLPLRTNFGLVATSSKELAVAIARTTGTVLGAGIGRTVGMAGSVIGGSVRAAGALTGAAMRTMFSLPGMVGMLAGHALWSKASDANKAGTDIEPLLNPIQRYNDKLGTTTTNLATFSQGLSSSGEALKTLSTMTIKQATFFGDSDQSSAPKNPINKVWDGVASAKDPTLLAQSILQSMPISSGGQLKLAEQDMSAAGLNKDQVNQVVSQYMAAGGPSKTSGLGNTKLIAEQGKAAAAAEGTDYLDLTSKNVQKAGMWAGAGAGAAGGAAFGSIVPGVGTAIGGVIGGIGGGFAGYFGGGKAAEHFHVNPSQASLAYNANMISGVSSQQASDTTSKGGAYADQRAMLSYMAGLGPEVAAGGAKGTFGERQRRAVATALSTITGGGESSYFKSMQGQKLRPDMTAEEQWASVVKTLGAEKHGQKYLANLNTEGVNLTGPKAAERNLINVANTTDGSDFNSVLKGYGKLGAYSAKSGLVQEAIGINQDKASTQFDAAKALEGVAEGGKKVTDGYADAVARLTMFAARVGDASGAMGKLIDRATAEEMQKQQLLQPYQSHSQNLEQSGRTYRQTAVQYNMAKAQGLDTTSAEANMAKAKDTYTQQLASEQAYNTQIIQTVQQFHTQQSRADEDFNHSKLVAQDAFQLQSTYSLKDFQLQQSRTIHDHNRQLVESAQSAAQSIYDPYTRVEAKYALSAGEVADNLHDQNQRIAEQQNNLAKLHKQGLSTQAIQTLDLANPNNAQQTNELTSSLANNPAEIARLNRESKARAKNTQKLTQSPDSLAFAQSQQDYKTSLQRSSDDFVTQTKRATKQQSISLSETAYQFRTQTHRAAQDLTQSARIISGSFADVRKQAEAAVKTISSKAPGAAKIWRDAFKTDNIIHLLGLDDPNALITAGIAAGKAIVKGLKMGDQANSGSQRDNSTHPASGQTLGSIVGLGLNASGGIATRAQAGIFGEAGPEALIPLNQTGQDFMAGLIAKALGQAMTMTGGGSSTSSTVVDSSTNFSGAVTVVSQDTKAFERDMKAKARLKKLTSPVRH